MHYVEQEQEQEQEGASPSDSNQPWRGTLKPGETKQFFLIVPKLFFLMPPPPQVADELIDAVKKGLGSRLACSLPLPDYSAGEVNIIFRSL